MFFVSPVSAVDFTGGTINAQQHLTQDSNIFSGTIFDPSANIYIDSSLQLQNSGKIFSDIFIADARELLFQNSGDFYGTIYFGENSSLVQVIKNSSDLKQLSLGSDGRFSILVQSSETLPLAGIMHIAGNADKIILDNATISLAGGDANFARSSVVSGVKVSAPSIELAGEVWLELSNTKIYNGMRLMSGVSGDGAVNIRALDLGTLFYANAYRSGSDLFLNLSRELDYEKIFGMGDIKGKFINQMRISGEHEKLLAALDSQMSMDGVRGVMNKSYAFNPTRLSVASQVWNTFESLPTLDVPKDFSIEPIFIFGNNINMLAGKLKGNIKYENWNFGLSGHYGTFSASDSIEDVRGDFYGANLHAYYDYKSLWMHSTAGLSKYNFDTDAIFIDGNSIYNPSATSMYLSADGGMKFDYDDFYLSPFVGAGIDSFSILSGSKRDVYARAGGIAGSKFEIDGLKYDYSVFAAAQSNNTLVGGITAGFWSIEDAAGGDLRFQAMRLDALMAYKISLEVKFDF